MRKLYVLVVFHESVFCKNRFFCGAANFFSKKCGLDFEFLFMIQFGRTPKIAHSRLPFSASGRPSDQEIVTAAQKYVSLAQEDRRHIPESVKSARPQELVGGGTPNVASQELRAICKAFNVLFWKSLYVLRLAVTGKQISAYT